MYNVDLNLYKVFCTVAEAKSITKASKILFVSQQAVSYNIKQLESSLGGKLFFRTPKGVMLTPEAKRLYNQIKEAFTNISVGEKFFTESKELLYGDIHIGCNSNLFNDCLCEYIDKFHKLYPNIKISIIGKPVCDLTAMLENHQLDMFIRKFPNEINCLDFSVKIFSSSIFCFFCNQDFKKIASKKNVSLKELSAIPLLLLNKNSYEREYIENHFTDKKLKIKAVMEFTNHAPLIHLAKLGYGIGYASIESIKNELKEQKLFQVHVNEIVNDIQVGIVYNKHYLSHAGSKLIEIMGK